ncbi:PP2C family protein-serine/threonine phosphatase [Pullulanibacillus sp. KACC 23026]|uniref:PP2C family protein-serine/threonine phosphatase n=1 Tax=Pullulanibacillus sp. KACC 23026 TaxID=3028315 RepID=UPI0023B0B27A|nr:PP2C family protein-serine/threonine phosphatase [Pullulanibacillus sp. KACC 23026]WEG12464.1 PP2C family protein-serine/threonine phosphatase [Pullulanibacillus sp. KACC 23026]
MVYDALSIPFHSNSSPEIDKSLQREIKLAKNIQMTLLNGKVPTFKGGKVSGQTLPARLIGGDYYDFYPLSNGTIRIVIGDVMGKGIPAAMLMILTRGAFRSAAGSCKGPGETLNAINQALYDDLRALGSFVTLFCADWDPSKRILTYANAGHNLPLHINNENNVISSLHKTSGIMIGGLPNQTYQEGNIQLRCNDTVFFYTDGIVEAKNEEGEQFQLERLINTLTEHKHESAELIGQRVIEAINSFTKDLPQKDDITMVLLKISENM